MTTGFSGVETLSTLDRDLLNLPDLTDELLLLSELMGVFILSSLKGLINFLFDRVSNFLISLLK